MQPACLRSLSRGSREPRRSRGRRIPPKLRSGSRNPPKRRSGSRTTPLRLGVAALGTAALVAGCYISNEGLTPVQGIYYPTGLVVSPGRTTLYIANSDFDLQYNGGTVLAADLKALEARLTTLSSAIRDIGAGTSKLSLDEACRAFLDPCQDKSCGGKTPVCELSEDLATASCVGSCGGAKCPGGQACIAGACATLDAFRNKSVILYPGPCGQLPLVAKTTDSDGKDVEVPVDRFVKKVATLGAFASGAVLVQRPDAPGARLFVPVRGDPSVTYFDVADDRQASPTCATGPDPSQAFCLACAETGDERRCGDSHRIGLDPYDNTRQLSLPVEPVGVAASEDGEAIVVAHQTQQAVSLTVNRWPNAMNTQEKPTLEFIVGGLPNGPTDVATLPKPGVIVASQALGKLHKNGDPPIASYLPGFLVTYNASAQIDLFRFDNDAAAQPPRPFLSRVLVTPVTTSSDGKDSRGIVIDATERQACEAPCKDASTTCVAACGAADDACRHDCFAQALTCAQTKRCTDDHPLGLYVINRTPPALLTGKIDTTLVEDASGNVTGAFDVPRIEDSIPLAFGAAKITTGAVIGTDGALHTRIFATAFDSRLVFIFDPAAHRVEATIRTGRGPHPLIVDTDLKDEHAFLFVGHFTDSYMGVVDLDMRHADTYGTMFAAVGTPTPPKESK